MWETWVWSLSWEDHLEEGMATHFRFLAWRTPWTEEPGGLYSPWGCKESDVTEWLITAQRIQEETQSGWSSGSLKGSGRKISWFSSCRVFVNLWAVRSCRESRHRWPYPSWEESDKKGWTSLQSGSVSPSLDSPEGGAQQLCAPVPRLYNEENAPTSYLGEAPAVDQSGGNSAFNKKAGEKSQDSSGF